MTKKCMKDNWKYKVNEIIETDREGNKKQKETVFNTYGQAVYYIKQKLKDIIKKNTLKFFRSQNITLVKLNNYCDDEFMFWLEEADREQFSYVASYLEWSCFWLIEKII